MLCGGSPSRPHRLGGLTVWSTEPRWAAVYWRWVISDEGIPVVSDQLAIKSNLVFVEPGGVPTADDQLLGISSLVNALPWQPAVIAHLAGLPPPRPDKKRPGQQAAGS